MAAENPALLHYFLQDDLYLLNEDKAAYNGLPKQAMETPVDPIGAAIVTPDATPAIETPKANFKYLGANKKQFLILVNYPNDEYMAGAHLRALESTLGRKALAVEDVAIVNTNAYNSYTQEDYFRFFSPLKIVILGAASVPAGLLAPKLNVIETLANRQQLYTHSFDEMLADREKAKAFWEQMKNL